jgi:hypothetical protein
VGRPLDEAKVGLVFRGVLRRAGLPAFRVYDMRHIFASLLLARNAPITYVAAQLGHANPATTLRFYARWIPSRGQRWVEVSIDATTSRPPQRLYWPIWNQKWNQTVLLEEAPMRK